MTAAQKFHTILMVEDSPVDFKTCKRAFKEAGLLNPLYHVRDGDEALDYLYRRSDYRDLAKSPRPQLILLDLNLPGTDGREVLQVVKNDPSLRSIAVVVLTTSEDPKDVAKCYQAGANSYIQKPVHIEGFFEAIARLQEYWFEISILPNGEGNG